MICKQRVDDRCYEIIKSWLNITITSFHCERIYFGGIAGKKFTETFLVYVCHIEIENPSWKRAKILVNWDYRTCIVTHKIGLCSASNPIGLESPTLVGWFNCSFLIVYLFVSRSILFQFFGDIYQLIRFYYFSYMLFTCHFFVPIYIYFVSFCFSFLKDNKDWNWMNEWIK